jgi:hypothetical protein
MPKFASKAASVLAAFAITAAVFVCDIPDSFGDAVHAGPHDRIDASGRQPERELAVVSSHTLPIAEVSGLASIRSLSKESGKSSGGIDLYAVGDSSHEVVRFRIAGAKDEPDIQVHDTAPILGRHKDDASQWEAVATDGKDSVCMLSETHAEISCLDTRLQRVKARFNLDVSGIAGLDSAWKEQPNSRGEGMLLMKKGHVLVLKEKKPSMLIEFGPEGGQPIGYGPDTFLEPDEAFAGLAGSSGQPVYRANRSGEPAPRALVALKAWEFSSRVRELASDASEISLGPDGRVYLLSQESATLIRLEKTLKPGERKAGMEHGAYWRLPQGMDKAEGLVIDDVMHPWVGIDIKQTGRPNLFRLSPIEDQP